MDTHHYLANYDIEQEIGQGSFATVFLGHEKVKETIKNLLRQNFGVDNKGEGGC